MITYIYISITVGDIKIELFLLKTNIVKFTQQKFERKNQRNKCFIKLFTNVQNASFCLSVSFKYWSKCSL